MGERRILYRSKTLWREHWIHSLCRSLLYTSSLSHCCSLPLFSVFASFLILAYISVIPFCPFLPTPLSSFPPNPSAIIPLYLLYLRTYTSHLSSSIALPCFLLPTSFPLHFPLSLSTWRPLISSTPFLLPTCTYNIDKA